MRVRDSREGEGKGREGEGLYTYSIISFVRKGVGRLGLEEGEVLSSFVLDISLNVLQ